jgi:transposase InsO family protein
MQSSTATSVALAARHEVSQQTIAKWRHRDFTQDASSRPLHIEYTLSPEEQALAVSMRQASWLPLDAVHEMLQEALGRNVARSAVYRTFERYEVNAIPEAQREKAKKFKDYQPGYLHIDVTYLPKFNGVREYLYVAIDRATRAVLYQRYPNKTAEAAEDFFGQCVDFFPFGITHVLTDNGLEFTNRFIKKKDGKYCKKPSKLDAKCAEVGAEHRLTEPATPKTNGMVERVNGTIKSNTILKSNYESPEQMHQDLDDFLIYYNLQRRHGSLKKELQVRTPYEAIEKWYLLEPQLFTKTPTQFKLALLSLHQNKPTKNQQPCET